MILLIAGWVGSSYNALTKTCECKTNVKNTSGTRATFKVDNTNATYYEVQPFGFQARTLKVQYAIISILLEQQQPILKTGIICVIVSAARSVEMTHLTFNPWSTPNPSHMFRSLLFNTQLFSVQTIALMNISSRCASGKASAAARVCLCDFLLTFYCCMLQRTA